MYGLLRSDGTADRHHIRQFFSAPKFSMELVNQRATLCAVAHP